MKRSESKIRAEEVEHTRRLIRTIKTFNELDMALVQRLNEINIIRHEPADAEKSKLDELLNEVVEEYIRSTNIHGPIVSPHAGASIIREEFEELWEQVKLHKSKRDAQNMKRECIQIAASAIHFVTDVLKTR